jgi:hypothetical protein
MQKKSMNYFFGASDGSPNSLRVHPLLLSLTAAFAKSDKLPDIGSVSCCTAHGAARRLQKTHL